MKAWVLYDFGDFRLCDVEEPTDIPRGHVKLRVCTVQPSITESALMSGLPIYNLELVRRKLEAGPCRLFGHEFSGEVVETGEGVRDLDVGQRVASRSLSSCGQCLLCRSGRRDECQKGPITGFDIPGAFAEYVVVPSDSLIAIPDQISNEEGAALQALCDAVAGVSAARLRMGESTVVIGLGVMGLFCAQAATVSGAGRVIGIDVRDQSLQLAASFGIREIIDARTVDPVKLVLDLTDGAGAAVVFEAAGGPSEQGLGGDSMTTQAAQMASDGGKVVGLALPGEAAVLPYKVFRHRSIRYLFPDPLTVGLARHVVNLVARSLIDLKPMLAPPLMGIDAIAKSFDMTANKAAFGLINPAQVTIWEGTPR